jgi:hypothetical protein
MARKKTGKSRGRKSDFTGEKKDWLNTFHDQLRDAHDLPFSDNVDGDPEEQPPVILPTSDQDEKVRRDSIQKKLHLVSFFLEH